MSGYFEQKLEALLAERRIPGTLKYSNKYPLGWMLVSPMGDGKHMDRLGFNYFQAKEFIESGTMDFLAAGAK